MLRKITELWPSLVRSIGAEGEDAEQSKSHSSDQGSNAGQNQAIDTDQIVQDYRHIYWTRLMVVQGYELEQERKWPLGEDIIEECQAIEQLSTLDEEQWTPLFEPTQYNEQHGPLELQNHRLTAAQLEEWALRAVKIRASIV